MFTINGIKDIKKTKRTINKMVFDTVIKAICPHCLKDMKITNKNKTYCEECDFSWEDKNKYSFTLFDFRIGEEKL